MLIRVQKVNILIIYHLNTIKEGQTPTACLVRINFVQQWHIGHIQIPVEEITCLNKIPAPQHVITITDSN